MTAVSDDLLPVPGWAADHEEVERGVRWFRGGKVECLPDLVSEDHDTVEVEVYVQDQVEITDGHVTIRRDEPVEVLVDNRRMTLAQARQFAELISSLVDAVEAAS